MVCWDTPPPALPVYGALRVPVFLYQALCKIPQVSFFCKHAKMQAHIKKIFAINKSLMSTALHFAVC